MFQILLRSFYSIASGVLIKLVEPMNHNGDFHMLSKYSGKTVVGFGAHPDNLELGVGGTLARLSRAGARVVMAVVSIPNDLKSRRKEAMAAAKIIGAEVRFLSPNRCCRVEDTKNHQLVGMTDRLIKELLPTAVFTHSQSDIHIDHKLVHEACMASQRLRYFDLFCYPPTNSHMVQVPYHPHAYIDISDTIDIKMKAIKTHSSQFERRGLSADHYREISREMGQLIGVNYAETLEVVRIKLN